MIKFTLKSFLLSLKYFFIPILIMAICLVPAVIYFYFFIQNQMDSLTTSLSSELNTLSYDVAYEYAIEYKVSKSDVLLSIPY